jgi:hypothetical protein
MTSETLICNRRRAFSPDGVPAVRPVGVDRRLNSTQNTTSRRGPATVLGYK